MSVPAHDDLVDATMAYLPFYLGEGVSVDPFVRNLEPNLNVDGLTDILQYYFLLTGDTLDEGITRRFEVELELDATGGMCDSQGTPVGVMDFICLLPFRLRNLDPETQQQLKIFDGEVRGRVDWNQTLKQRYSDGNIQSQRFACKTRERTVHTEGNRVLIELLSRIQSIYTQDSQEILSNESDTLGWFSEWEVGGELRNLLEKQLNNVYLSKLNHDAVQVGERELAAVRNDRNPVYREAAALLDNYRRITRGDITNQEARNVLKMRPFAPPETREGKAALYEIYWIFQLLEQFDAPRFKPISSERGQLVAEWVEDGSRYLLFNDWNGKTHYEEDNYVDYLDISWGPGEVEGDPWDNYPDHFMRRREAVLTQQHHIAESVFGMQFGRKTPDIVLMKLVEQTPTPQLEGLFIGEVKHSDSNDYVKKGLRQLLEYGAHAKFGDHLSWADDRGGPYVAQNPEFLDADNVELGYFVGDASMIKGTPPSNLQICGFGEAPTRPF